LNSLPLRLFSPIYDTKAGGTNFQGLPEGFAEKNWPGGQAVGVGSGEERSAAYGARVWQFGDPELTRWASLCHTPVAGQNSESARDGLGMAWAALRTASEDGPYKSKSEVAVPSEAAAFCARRKSPPTRITQEHSQEWLCHEDRSSQEGRGARELRVLRRGKLFWGNIS
jgi:hypothetical protein